ncbi:MAG: 30S ribosomal protein S12 methylthiotransferase RimO [Firmicutes bacterium]|nr:30S ribosomal protein S12 methylthiotransferase RimO [Bacillota bacterium]
MNKKAKTVYIDTLGCPKNISDSEVAAGNLEAAGFSIVDDPETADIIMVNTCGFIEDAKKESIEHIFQMDDARKEGAKLVISGCLAQRYAQELFDEIPEADLIIGVNEYERVGELFRDLETRRAISGPCDLAPLEKSFRRYRETPYSASLKIAEGCNNRCTYCVIPQIRGPYRSKKMEDILEEARDLAAHGCKELILIAQDVAYYGLDLYKKKMLAPLLTELCKIEGIRWIRLMYCYDDRIDDELIRVMAAEEKICPYIDIPLQHASDRILKAMRRNSTRASIHKTLAKLREAIPDICIRTTLIVGFPGETDEDYEELVKMVEEEEFGRLGVFAYSQEEGTPAGEMPDQIEAEVKEARLDGIMMRQMEISRAHNESLIGRKLLCFVEGQEEDGTYNGRTVYDAPEIDNGVVFTSDRELKRGDMVPVLIRDAFDYDLSGVAVNE